MQDSYRAGKQKQNCLQGLLLVFILERYHNQHDLHPVGTVVQLPEPPEVCSGWLSLCFACAEGQRGTPLVARLMSWQDMWGLAGAFFRFTSRHTSTGHKWCFFSLSYEKTSPNPTAGSMAQSNSNISLGNMLKDHWVCFCYQMCTNPRYLYSQTCLPTNKT